MAHEFVDTVTATAPESVQAPYSIHVGDSFPITISFTLNGANPGSPTTSSYEVQWQETYPTAFSLVSPAPVSGASPSTDYVGTIPGATIFPSTGTYRFRGVVYYSSDAAPPNNEQYTYSDEITIHVMAAAEETPATGT